MAAINLNNINDIIRDIAAAEIMPRFRKLSEGDVEMKGVNDPVTVADKETERRLAEELTRALPGSTVVGEESFAKDRSVMQRLDSGQPVWIIDPIDGTKNFVAGNPEFAVMVALLRNHEPVASWIHDPNSGDTIMAEQGAGVWLRGKKLRLAAADASLPTVGVIGTRVRKFISDPSLLPSGVRIPPIEYGSCAGFTYPRLFNGEASFADSPQLRASFLFYLHTNAWDHAPGLFLHREAGGYSADWSGQPYDMHQPLGGLLLAPDRKIWTELRSLFDPLILQVQKTIH